METNHQRGLACYRALGRRVQFLPAQTELHGLGDGRIVERRVDTWIESELRRFHCGISCVLLLLATVILVAETFRYPRGRDCGALALLLFSLALAQVKLVPSLLYGRKIQHF